MLSFICATSYSLVSSPMALVILIKQIIYCSMGLSADGGKRSAPCGACLLKAFFYSSLHFLHFLYVIPCNGVSKIKNSLGGLRYAPEAVLGNCLGSFLLGFYPLKPPWSP